jgi:putative addiction module component (TIGR02574 family)
MAVTVETLGIDRLSVAERLNLIEDIWDSLPEELSPSEVPAWHLPELRRRREAARVQPGVGKAWREVLASLERRP